MYDLYRVGLSLGDVVRVENGVDRGKLFEKEKQEEEEEERPNRCTIGGGLTGLQHHPANQFEAGSCPVASLPGVLSCSQVSTTKLLEVEDGECDLVVGG